MKVPDESPFLAKLHVAGLRSLRDKKFNICTVINKVFSVLKTLFPFYPANIYLFKVKSRNTRKRCEIGLKLAIKTPERRH